VALKVRKVPFSFVLAPLLAIAMLPAFGADTAYNGGKPTNPKDLKGKKIVLADVPKLVGIGYFAATTKGEAEAAAELTKNGSFRPRSPPTHRPRRRSRSRSSISTMIFPKV